MASGNTNHWRFNQPVLAELLPTYAIDLLGFGNSDRPRARLKDEPDSADAVHYGFDLNNRWLTSAMVVQRPCCWSTTPSAGLGPAGRTTLGRSLPWWC